ncbi:hypothetical protein ACJMK2_031357 [Sinanodonta woodiana]|uniref:CCHC-type domain-containing protein n=1 Tax=Sinanodonta woodiana TaxID=1069815 RepID=A0ABD3X2I1_SINWO
MRLRIQQSNPKTLEEVTRLAVQLEAIQNADKQRDRRTTTKVRNIGVDDVKCSPSGIVDIQACIKELSSKIREIKVELDSLKKKRVERLFNRQESKKCWICGSEEHLKNNCLTLRANRNWQDQQGRI